MEQRNRLNAKQNAKGSWYFDVTVEVSNDEVISSEKQVNATIQLIETAKKQFTENGLKLVDE